MKKSIKYFPWSPGLPWTLKNGKYVLPELPFDTLAQCLKDKELVVCAPGEALETYYSFWTLEVLNYHFPANKFSWFGNSSFYPELKNQGIAKPFNKVTSDDLKRFPTPIFFDKNNRAYFNCLYNYTYRQTYYLTDPTPLKSPIISNILANSTIAFEERFPQFRLSDFSDFYQTNKISKNIILLIDCSESLHQAKLGWTTQQFKSLIAFLSQTSKEVVILSDEPKKYWGTKCKAFKFQLDLLIDLLPRAKWLISENIDIPLIALSVSEGLNIVFSKTEGYLDLEKNNQLFNKANLFLNEWTPWDIYTLIKEKSE